MPGHPEDVPDAEQIVAANRERGCARMLEDDHQVRPNRLCEPDQQVLCQCFLLGDRMLQMLHSDRAALKAEKAAHRESAAAWSRPEQEIRVELEPVGSAPGPSSAPSI